MLRFCEIVTQKLRRSEWLYWPLKLLPDSFPTASMQLPCRKRCLFAEKIKFLENKFGDKKIIPTFAIPKQTRRTWRGGRVVDCGGLENRWSERIRGFESLPLRNKPWKSRICKICTRKCTRNAQFQHDFGRFSFSVFLVFATLKTLIFNRFFF